MSKKDSISKDDVCYLIPTIIVKDELLQEIRKDGEPRQVFCAALSIGQREFSVSFVNALKAEKVLLLDYDEYDGEEIVIHDDQHYIIYRTFVRDDGDIELYCAMRAGVSNGH
ncbi:hypothetical protein [Ureibacillus sp. FSL W8-0352]|uniref:hypothetical protein n=1 Tax=Ureibacillus sp. FSL W8-0352 TaxID=2954596 RepID=UPI0030FA56CF